MESRQLGQLLRYQLEMLRTQIAAVESEASQFVLLVLQEADECLGTPSCQLEVLEFKLLDDHAPLQGC